MENVKQHERTLGKAHLEVRHLSQYQENAVLNARQSHECRNGPSS
jgi:hypothetical protein